MSILVKGMKMPKNCLECMFRISYWKRTLTPSGEIFTYGCMLNRKEINILEKRCKDCPIVEIPTPHGRLIDADRFLGWIEEFHPNDVAIMSGVKNARTVIEAEVSE